MNNSNIMLNGSAYNKSKVILLIPTCAYVPDVNCSTDLRRAWQFILYSGLSAIWSSLRDLIMWMSVKYIKSDRLADGLMVENVGLSSRVSTTQAL